MNEQSPLKILLNTLPQQGELLWIGVRPARDQSMIEVQQAKVEIGKGIIGDRFSGNAQSKRQVTLIQAEHLPVIAALVHTNKINPATLRRNLVVSGINLLALKDKQFQIGSVIFNMTGLCHPCSKMETLLGAGGYNAMRGHGGITASVITPGIIEVGNKVAMFAEQA